MRRDDFTATVEAAAAHAVMLEPPADEFDEPIDERGDRGFGTGPAYNGRCVVCGKHANPRQPGGVKFGPLHPACERRTGFRDGAENARYRALRKAAA